MSFSRNMCDNIIRRVNLWIDWWPKKSHFDWFCLAKSEIACLSMIGGEAQICFAFLCYFHSSNDNSSALFRADRERRYRPNLFVNHLYLVIECCLDPSKRELLPRRRKKGKFLFTEIICFPAVWIGIRGFAKRWIEFENKIFLCKPYAHARLFASRFRLWFQYWGNFRDISGVVVVWKISTWKLKTSISWLR